jgi:hypothetical protein
MKKLNNTAIAMAVALACSTGAIAMTKEEHKAAAQRIEADYKSDRAACNMTAKNANDICKAEAKGKENVAKAELEINFKPTQKNRYDARIVKANAAYAVAKERCDDKSGNAKAVCLKEAEANQTAARADAKAWMKTAEANQIAREEGTATHAKATEKAAVAQKDAAADKRNAELELANAKCDALAGDAKTACSADAKARYGKI